MRTTLVMVTICVCMVHCLPPPHPDVVAVRRHEANLHPSLRSPALRNPRLLKILPLTSLLHKGENLVIEREASKIKRIEVYKMLTHAGFLSRHGFSLPSAYTSYGNNEVITPVLGQDSYDTLYFPGLMMVKANGICKALIKDYCANCSFAGIHYIADETKHWSERFLWVIFVILSWCGSGVLIIAAWDAFVENPISFGVETTYTEWNTKMPTVAICESSNDGQIYNVSDTIWPPGHLLDLEDALKEIAYFRGVSFVLIDTCYLNPTPDPLCPKSNYSYYAKLVRSDCTKIMKNCSYNGNEFTCCEYFQPLETDIGRCYILNSIQTSKPRPYPMVSNMQNQRSIIKFEVSISSMMYTLAEDEVPTITTLLSSTLKIQLGNSYRRLLSVRNVENDPLIVETSPEQRACRFHHENEAGLYPHYSYSACTVLCRKQAQLDKCKCNDHFMINSTEEDRCNLTGMACLNSLSRNLTTLKPPWAVRPGLVCSCLPSCDETEITVIKDVTTSLKGKANKKRALVEIILSYLPTERFKRNVVRSHLDLVVSVGGTTGLFVGASLLSFVELIFFFTVRFISNLWMARMKKTKADILFVRPHKSDDLKIHYPEEFGIGRTDKQIRLGPYPTSGVNDIPNSYNDKLYQTMQKY